MRLLGIRGALLAYIAVVGISTQGNAQQGTSQLIARRQHVARRERWQASGRRIVGANSAALRSQAIRQKMQMRVANVANSAAAVVSGAWTSLGPLPLPSDASGIGLQDYSWVSGRATAVAIDPNDLSGNTGLCRRRLRRSLEIEECRRGNGTVTAINNYNSTVNLTCGAGMPPTCVVSPPRVVQSSGTSISVTVASGVSQTYNFNIDAVGTDAAAIAHSFPVTFDVRQGQAFDFAITSTPTNISTRVGQPAAIFTLDVDPGAAVFPNECRADVRGHVSRLRDIGELRPVPTGQRLRFQPVANSVWNFTHPYHLHHSHHGPSSGIVKVRWGCTIRGVPISRRAIAEAQQSIIETPAACKVLSRFHADAQLHLLRRRAARKWEWRRWKRKSGDSHFDLQHHVYRDIDFRFAGSLRPSDSDRHPLKAV